MAEHVCKIFLNIEVIRRNCAVDEKNSGAIPSVLQFILDDTRVIHLGDNWYLVPKPFLGALDESEYTTEPL
jgi:hypothetical protein